MFKFRQVSLGLASLLLLACSDDGGDDQGVGGSGASGGGSARGGQAGAAQTGVGGSNANGGSMPSGGSSVAESGGTSGSSPGATGGSAGIAGSSSAQTSTPTYAVIVNAPDVLGGGLVLQLNGTSNLSVPSPGSVPFPTRLGSGTSYAVTVVTQPSNPRQLCRVKNGSGQIAASEVSVSVSCTQLPRYYLAADSADKSVSTYAIDDASGRSTYVGKAETGSSPQSVALHPLASIAYVANGGDGTVSQYRVGVDGSLTPLGSPINAGVGLRSITLSASGTSAYALTGGGLMRLTVGADGALTEPAVLVTGGTLSSLTLHPTHDFAYLTDSAAKKVTRYILAGSPTTASAPVAADTGSDPVAVVLDAEGGFAFVINKGDNNISQYSVNADGTLAPVAAAPTIAVGAQPVSLALDPLGRYAYVVNSGSGTISQHKLVNGVMSATGTMIPTEAGPSSILLDPIGKYAYVANVAGNSVSQFAVNADGTLAANAPSRVPAQVNPVSLAMVTGKKFTERFGKFAYVANGDDLIWRFRISDPGGALTDSMSVNVANMGPYSIAVHPSGRFAYVANSSDASVSQYAVGSAGELAGLTQPPQIAAGSYPVGVAVDPSGKYAYVANQLDRRISQYGIDKTGMLTPLNPPFVSAAAQGNPLSVLIDPSGRYAYVPMTNGTVAIMGIDGATGKLGVPTNAAVGAAPNGACISSNGKGFYFADTGADQVLQFAIDQAGALLPMSPPSAAAGDQPVAVAIDPTGTFAYAANLGSSDVSSFTIEAGRLTTPKTTGLGTVGTDRPYAIAVDPAGKYLYIVNYRDTSGGIWQYSIGADRTLLPMTPASVPVGANSQSIVILGGYR